MLCNFRHSSTTDNHSFIIIVIIIIIWVCFQATTTRLSLSPDIVSILQWMIISDNFYYGRKMAYKIDLML